MIRFAWLLGQGGWPPENWLGTQSAIDSAGTQSASIEALWWYYFYVTLAIYGVVILFILGAMLWRSARNTSETKVPSNERWLKFVFANAIVLTAIILVDLLFNDHLAARAMDLTSPPTVKIRVTAQQWWWSFEYDDTLPSNIFTTANEIHLPVGQVVEFELISTDVIHSFWIPNLSGKQDVVPAMQIHLRLQPTKVGTYWGQCAEFCGLQHAQMRFRVVVESPEDFQRWLSHQRSPGSTPENEAQQRGQQQFLKSTCIMCHAIQGTSAMGSVGPDLTQVGSRPWIAGGSLANNRGNLAAWIADPQQHKPGARMPAHLLGGQELRDVAEYLESLR
jgi:cytochrome c oxidase subunit 2